MELRYRIALSVLPGVGTYTCKALVEEHGSAEAFFTAPQTGAPKRLPRGVDQKDLETALRQADDELEKMLKLGIRGILPEESEYPELLREIPDPPPVLYVRGQIPDMPRPVAVVGTRQATPYGLDQTKHFVHAWADYHIGVVSGMAFGIDQAAHRAALDAKLPTIGVVAHGLNLIYPAQHKKLAYQILDAGGGLVTEFRVGQAPDRENFPKRNRIIAGSCKATVVMEAAGKGGALITARLARDYNREIFALPGKLIDPWSRGCLELIQEQIAIPLIVPEDLGREYGWSTPKAGKQIKLFQPVNPLQEELKRLLLKRNYQLDELTLHLNQPVQVINAELLQLELMGAVRGLPGKIYTWIGQAS